MLTFTNDGSVSILDAATGGVLRTKPLGIVSFLGLVGQYLNYPPAPQNIAVDEQTGRVFLIRTIGKLDRSGYPSGPGRVSMLDAATGRVLRTITVGTGPDGLAVDARTRRVFVTNMVGGSYPASVSVLDARTGAVLRTVPMPFGIPAPVVAARLGRVFIVTRDGISVLDARTGALLRTMTVPDPNDPYSSDAPCALAVDERTRHVVAGLSGPERDVTAVAVLDALTGATLHGVRFIGPEDECPVVVDQSSSRGFVYQTPCYMALGPSSVTVLDMHTGRVVNTVSLPRANFIAAMAVETWTRRVLVATGDYVGRLPRTQLNVLDATTGRILRSIQLDVGPPAMAVDAQSKRVFVVNTGAGTVSVLDARRV